MHVKAQAGKDAGDASKETGRMRENEREAGGRAGRQAGREGRAHDERQVVPRQATITPGSFSEVWGGGRGRDGPIKTRRWGVLITLLTRLMDGAK